MCLLNVNMLVSLLMCESSMAHFHGLFCFSMLLTDCNIVYRTENRIMGSGHLILLYFCFKLQASDNAAFTGYETCELFTCNVYLNNVCDVLCIAQAGKDILMFLQEGFAVGS